MRGILLVNLGTPDAPTPQAVKKYLAEFLSDPRVVEIPRFIWKIILHGIILQTRPKKSAKLYQAIWQKNGSPLLNYTHSLANKLQQALKNKHSVKVGMRYGNPSIASQLEELKHCEEIIILPLYPQSAAATTATTFDAIAKHLEKWRYIPTLTFISNYYQHPLYIQAISQQIEQHWQTYARGEKLVFSFHGLPERCTELGDPYASQCQTTAKLVAQQLKLSDKDYIVTFQSRFGPAKWLQPYTDKTLIQLAQDGINNIDIICPGFAVDCLETLEEIAKTNKELFITNGGKNFRYIPCLNDSDNHVALFKHIIDQA